MKKRNRLYVVMFLIVCILAAGIFAALQYRIRGSVKVLPDTDVAGAQPVFYSQKDIRWAEDMLGDSDYTMESSGCLVTCIAAAMEMSDIR